MNIITKSGIEFQIWFYKDRKPYMMHFLEPFMTDHDNVRFLATQKVNLQNFCLNTNEGWILDIGGGGEGIIGLIGKDKVVAIDVQKRELEEADISALKIQMDAADLKFTDNQFHTVTSFFTLMFVKGNQKYSQIFKEIKRVLKPQGKFFLWDIDFEVEPDPEKPITAFHLEITMPDGSIHKTGYGTKKTIQNFQTYLDLAKESGFKLKEQKSTDLVRFAHFQLK